MPKGLRFAIASALSVAALFALAPAANAYVYWSNSDSIGRAKLDGSNVNKSFIAVGSSGGGGVQDVAVDSSHLFWINDYAGTVADSIGQSGLTGWSKTQSLIGPSGSYVRQPLRLAVTSSNIYWANCNGATVGRASIDGSTPSGYWLNASPCTSAVAVDGTHVYWVSRGASVTVGRTNLDGTGSTNLITGLDAGALAPDIAVDSNYLYWTNYLTGAIGRADLDGSNPDASFITGTSQPRGLAIGSGRIYWSSAGTGQIGRATLNGAGAASNVQQDFITGVSAANGIAVDSLDPATSPAGSLAPTTDGFGDDPISDGPSAARTFTLSSSGTADLTIPASGITLTGTNSDQFQVTGGTCVAGTSSLSNGQSCTVNVAFNPSSVGVKSATLQVQTNDGDKTATLSGTGITAPAGSFSPSTLSFGSQPVSGGPTSRADVTLNSTGTGNLVLSGAPSAAGDYGDFNIYSASCNGTDSVEGGRAIPSGSSCVWTIEFNPDSVGAKSMTLSIGTNDGTKSATITGTGTAPAGSVSPSSYGYGNVKAGGGQKLATFTLTSSGGVPLDIDGFSVSGSGGENFGVTGDGTCSIATTVLANGQTCTVIVNFAPLTIGEKLASLDIATNDGLKSVSLAGVGVPAPTVTGSGKATKTSLKVKLGCGDQNACSLRLTGNKVGSEAALVSKTVAVGVGQSPVVTLAYTKALKKALARGGQVRVTATNTVSGVVASVAVRVAK